jgi:ribosome biogenesis GTPase
MPRRPPAERTAPAGAASPGTLPGLVVAAHGSHVVVEDSLGARHHCHLRGRGRGREGIVVGDQVRWRATGDVGVVEQVEPRRNLMHRQDEWRSKSFAANLDQVLVLVAARPEWSDLLLARALVAAADAGIPAIVALNKTDLPEASAARERLQPLQRLAVPLLPLSLKGDAAGARALLEPRLAGRVTLVLGPSGMGKSTLVNTLVPAAEAQVGELSRALGGGRHTTTTARWYALGTEAGAGALIDSPGFQTFGIRHVGAERLALLMPDIAEAASAGCRFANCGHRHEPGCAVREALAAGRIDPKRFAAYEALHDELLAAGPAPRRGG